MPYIKLLAGLLERKVTLLIIIGFISDIDHLYTQGLTIAAALQGKTVSDVPFQQRHQGPGTVRSTGSPGTALGVVLWGITSGNVLIG